MYLCIQKNTDINLEIPNSSEENTFLVLHCLKLSSKDLNSVLFEYICKLELIVHLYNKFHVQSLHELCININIHSSIKYQ